MDYADHVAATRDAVEVFTAALAAGPVDAPVPTCPDWTVTDLVRHVGEFTSFWTHVLCEGTQRPKPPYPPMPPDDLTGWYEGLAASLLAELEATPPDTVTWSWAPGHQTARFTARRVAHELTIHRVDMEAARRTGPAPIEPAVAADGIEEMIFLATALNAGQGAGERLHLHGTDRGDEWMLTMTPDGLHVDREHGKGDLAIRGSVADLELLLYQRPLIGSVERFGDDAALEAWYRAFTFA
jgi:uncharacterized protein (TIGR03083 family)